jgi:hydrocephalus-inducing protein
MFTPNSDKPFTQKLMFKFKENQKQFVLNVKGQSTNNSVELISEAIKLRPILPYHTKSIEYFNIVNTMDHPIEIYSLDFDKQYLTKE